MLTLVGTVTKIDMLLKPILNGFSTDTGIQLMILLKPTNDAIIFRFSPRINKKDEKKEEKCIFPCFFYKARPFILKPYLSYNDFNN